MSTELERERYSEAMIGGNVLRWRIVRYSIGIAEGTFLADLDMSPEAIRQLTHLTQARTTARDLRLDGLDRSWPIVLAAEPKWERYHDCPTCGQPIESVLTAGPGQGPWNHRCSFLTVTPHE